MARSARTALALALALGLALASTAKAQPADPNQQAFTAGMAAAGRGETATAIVILEALADRTDAPRVRLELARLLFQAGEFRRAKGEFLRVYRRDLPYPVRRAVNVYLDEIDRRIGYLQPELGLVGDSNPTRAARSGDYDLLGASFAYRSSAKRTVGVRYKLAGALPITPPLASQWLASASIEGVEFPGPADYGAISAALRREDHVQDSALTAGWRWRDQQQVRSEAPFVQYDRRWAPRRNQQITVQALLELDRYPTRPDLNGTTFTGAVNYQRDLGADTTLRLGAAGIWGPSADGLLPHQTLVGQLGASRSVRPLKANVTVDLTLAQADFSGVDPFFGKVRTDRTASLALGFYRAAPIWGLFPGLVASVEQRQSSIDFFGYRRAGLSMDFRRRF